MEYFTNELCASPCDGRFAMMLPEVNFWGRIPCSAAGLLDECYHLIVPVGQDGAFGIGVVIESCREWFNIFAADVLRRTNQVSC